MTSASTTEIWRGKMGRSAVALFYLVLRPVLARFGTAS